MANPYDVLGVRSSAGDEELTQAYRKLAKKHHPDLNPGDAAAEEKMREINAAYKQIRALREGAAAESQTAAGQGRESAREDAAAREADFRQQQHHAARMNEIRRHLRAAQYQQALRKLGEMGAFGAEWHYLSALANAGAGNRVTALEHAREAVRLQPQNPEYQSLLQRFEQGIYHYRRTGQDYGFVMKRVGVVLGLVFLSQFFCFTCCRPG